MKIKISRFKAEKLAVTREIVFAIISKGKIFRAARKKKILIPYQGKKSREKVTKLFASD